MGGAWAGTEPLDDSMVKVTRLVENAALFLSVDPALRPLVGVAQKCSTLSRRS
jgi:hypothetical protein